MNDAVIKITGENAKLAKRLAAKLHLSREAVIRKALIFFDTGVYTPIQRKKAIR